MHMLLPTLRRTPALTIAFCIALTVLLTGCASKNPLIDEPAGKSAQKAETASARPVLPEPVLVVKPAPETKPAAVDDLSKAAPTGVKRWLGIFTPYKINIQQGNFISQDMAAKLRPGMTKEQVRFVLGTPLLTDLFHADRWDYLFRLQKPNGELTANRVAIFFVDNRVERIDSGELPSESDYLSHIVGPAPVSKEDAPKPAASPDSKPSTQSISNE